jgi:hypothetical protein
MKKKRKTLSVLNSKTPKDLKDGIEAADSDLLIFDISAGNDHVLAIDSNYLVWHEVRVIMASYILAFFSIAEINP